MDVKESFYLTNSIARLFQLPEIVALPEISYDSAAPTFEESVFLNPQDYLNEFSMPETENSFIVGSTSQEIYTEKPEAAYTDFSETSDLNIAIDAPEITNFDPSQYLFASDKEGSPSLYVSAQSPIYSTEETLEEQNQYNNTLEVETLNGAPEISNTEQTVKNDVRLHDNNVVQMLRELSEIKHK